jgi:hypothetical protein
VIQTAFLSSVNHPRSCTCLETRKNRNSTQKQKIKVIESEEKRERKANTAWEVNTL